MNDRVVVVNTNAREPSIGVICYTLPNVLILFLFFVVRVFLSWVCLITVFYESFADLMGQHSAPMVQTFGVIDNKTLVSFTSTDQTCSSLDNTNFVYNKGIMVYRRTITIVPCDRTSPMSYGNVNVHQTHRHQT